MTAIAQVHAMATHDQASERDAVFKAIFDNGCSTVEEIMEETYLARAPIQRVIDELVMKNLIQIRRRPEAFRDEEPQYLPANGFSSPLDK